MKRKLISTHFQRTFSQCNRRMIGLFFSFLFISSQAWCMKDTVSASVKLSAASSGLVVEDNQYAFMTGHSDWASTSFIQKKVYNTVGLRINYNNPAALQNGVVLSVNVKISYWKWNDNLQPKAGFELLEKRTTLSLNFKNDQSEAKDIHLFRFEGGNKFTVTLECPPCDQLPAHVDLVGAIEVDRIYNMSLDAVQPEKLNHTYVAASNELLVQWEPVYGAESYDLEWSYVNNYGDTPGTFLKMNEIDLPVRFFKNNSSRVSVAAGSENEGYRIPMVYEAGFILYRLRAVGKVFDVTQSKTIAGAWSKDDSQEQTVESFARQGSSGNTTKQHVYTFAGHDTHLNWRNQISFAEEGKHKSAVDYYDGTLRNRQSIVKLNTENQVLVGEVFYDHAGRSSVHALPVPTQKNKLNYYPHFNLADTDGKPYAFRHFEIADPQNTCEIKATAMSTSSGASNYYSPVSTSLANDPQGQQSYLPDAEKYPFSQILYTADNTGRIKKEGTVGPAHQLGGGHENTYQYAKPEQEELDKLFGSEAGLAEHYKKDITIDANGQTSVQYTNAKGQVVATALKGASPANLEALPSNIPTGEEVSDLLGKNTANPLGQNNTLTIKDNYGSLELSQQQQIGTDLSVNGKREYTYSFTVSPFQFHACTDQQQPLFTKDGMLDLELSLADECGNQQLLDGGQGSIIRKTISGNGGAVSFNGNWPTHLKAGTYTLSKKLSINKSYLDKLTLDYLNTTSCIRKLDQVIADAIREFDPQNCVDNCQPCQDALQRDYPNPPQDVTDIHYDDYQLRKNECTIFCGGTPNKCASALQAMMADMSPHGQYGLLREHNPEVAGDGSVSIQVDLGSANKLTPEIYPLSVYNENNLLPHYKVRKKTSEEDLEALFVYPSFRTPVDLNGNHAPYRNLDGSEAMIYIQKIGSTDTGTPIFFPEIVATVAQAHANEKTFLVKPQELTLEAFVQNWKPQWAQSLVYYHPEYPIYQNCIAHQAAQVYMEDLINTNSVAVAQQKGFINSDGKTNLEKDPFFNIGDASVSFALLNPFFEKRGFFDVLLGNNKANPKKVYHDLAITYMNHFSKLSPTEDLTLWETANMLVNCPKTSSLIECPAVPNCPKGGVVDNDDIWKHYKTVYVSFRQFFEDQYQELASIRVGDLNTCIGNKDYVPTNVTGYMDEDPFGSIFSTSRYWMNRSQPCSQGSYVVGGAPNYTLYAKKTPRFPLHGSASEDDEFKADYCYNNDWKGLMDVSNCIPNVEQAQEKIQQKYYLKTFNACGQCPLAKDLEVFLNGFANRHPLNSDQQLGCFPSSDVPELTDGLLVALGFDHLGQLSWKKDPSMLNDNFTLNIALTDADIDDDVCHFLFRIPQGNYDISQIKQISELHFNPSPQLFVLGPDDAGKTFSFTATLNDGRVLSGEGRSSCMRIDNCVFEPLCNATQVGYHFVNLLNGIAFGFGTQNQLLQHVDLSTEPYSAFITPELKNALYAMVLTDYTPTLSADQNTLDIVIHSVGVVASGDALISLTKEETDYSFTDIRSFDAILRDKT
ncbi:MAG: hypothetical protein JWM14_3202 [Chitinophagaceae bacterium]|nr:hypothetical protein [Chitinophagaceae bacterium]